MEGSFSLTLQIVLAVLAGIGAQVFAEYLKVPSIVFLLLFGIFLGSDGLNLLHPHELGVGLEVLVALAVAIILFEGGLNLELKELGRVSGSLRNLVTLGTLVTLVLGGMAAHWLAEFPWAIAFLYASLVVVTGPTVIGPLLKQVAVDRRVATLLEGEGVLIDPVGAILAVVVLDTILNVNAGPWEVVNGLLFRLGIGAIIGAISGWLLGVFIKKTHFLSEDLKNLVVLAGVWGLFGLAQLSRSESGLMATVIAGIVMRASSLPEERMLRRFKGQLTVLCVSVLFILLAADLSLASIVALGWGSVWTVVCLMVLIRPLSVALCTWNSDLNFKQKLFVAWVAPKGIVSASVASLFAILLTEQGMNGGESIKALVFLTIMMTVFIQGLTARWVAQWLGITSAQARGAVIIGCNPISCLIARFFQEQGESVVLIDSDQEACDRAKQENLEVFHSNGLDPSTLEEAGIESMGTLLVLTKNGDVNSVLAQRAFEEFQPPRILAFLPPKGEGGNNSPKIGSVFMAEFPFKTWNQYLEDGQVRIGKTTLAAADPQPQQDTMATLCDRGVLLPLLIRRENRIQVVQSQEKWQPQDELFYLIHDPRPQLLKRLSGGKQTGGSLLEEKLDRIEELALHQLLTTDSPKETPGRSAGAPPQPPENPGQNLPKT